MARGSNAKNVVENKIAAAFGTDYIGNVGGKLYVWADDGGEKVQIALAMTCPKTFVDTPMDNSNVVDGGWDFSNAKEVIENQYNENMAEISQDELNKISNMMSKFGL